MRLSSDMQYSSTLLCVLYVFTPFSFQHLKQNVRLSSAANSFNFWCVFGLGDHGVGMLSALAYLYTAIAKVQATETSCSHFEKLSAHTCTHHMSSVLKAKVNRSLKNVPVRSLVIFRTPMLSCEHLFSSTHRYAA